MNKLLRRTGAVWLALGGLIGLHDMVAVTAAVVSPANEQWAQVSSLLLCGWMSLSISVALIWFVGFLVYIMWDAQ